MGGHSELRGGQRVNPGGCACWGWHPLGAVRMSGHVVVVGAGLGGLAAAVAMNAVGWDVTVLERAAELAEVGAGVGLWPNAVGALQRIDPALVRVLRGPSARRGGAGRRSAGGRWLVRLDASQIERRYGSPILLPSRPELLALLAARVPAGSVASMPISTFSLQVAHSVRIAFRNCPSVYLR